MVRAMITAIGLDVYIKAARHVTTQSTQSNADGSCRTDMDFGIVIWVVLVSAAVNAAFRRGQ